MHDLFYPQVGNFTLALLGSFNLALTPVAIVDDFMAPQTGRDAEADYIKQDIIRFAQRPGPTLLLAPAQEIGLTISLVDLLCQFARNPQDPVFATREVHRCHPDVRIRWPDPLPGELEEPVFINTGNRHENI